MAKRNGFKKGKGGKRGKSYKKVGEDQEESQQQGKGKKKKTEKKSKNSTFGDYELRQMIEEGSNGNREIVEMEADGNCLFRSISHQLHNDFGENHDAVRNEICNYLEENKEDFKIFLLLDDEEEDVMEFEDYVSEMREDATWGGDVEIVCAARYYKRQITIFSATGAYNIGIGDEDPSGPDLLLSYHENSHYNSVYEAERNSLHEIEQNQDEKKCSEIANGDVEINQSSSKNLPKRNDFCHCGSKRRYKKCCLEIDKSKIRSDKYKAKGSIEDKSAEATDDDSHEVEKVYGSFNILTI